ncbi:MAG: ankyrin repeat domain-containing protein [Alphaproteobacteria bacterium]|nr:MAG: ankyrin repeat domain-containing protein [Alphaproteobacteria bacterium]
MEEPDIFTAIDRGDANLVAELLTNPETRERALTGRDDKKRTALHYIVRAIIEAHDHQMPALATIFNSVANAFVEAGNVNARDYLGSTALDLALIASRPILAMRLLALGVEWDKNLLAKLTPQRKEGETPYWQVFLDVLRAEPESARLIAHMVVGNRDRVLQIANDHPEYYNRIPTLVWFLFIDMALLNGQDETVAAMLPMITHVRMAEIFFRAQRHGARATMKAALQWCSLATGLDDPCSLVLEHCIWAIYNDAIPSAWEMIDLCIRYENEQNPEPDERFFEDFETTITVLPDGLPPDCPLEQESRADMSPLESESVENIFARLAPLALNARCPRLLERAAQFLDDEDIIQIFDDAYIGAVDARSTVRIYDLGRVDLPITDCRTRALVRAIAHGADDLVPELLFSDAHPLCVTADRGWIPLHALWPPSPLFTPFFCMLNASDNGQWPERERDVALCLLAHTPYIEWWDVESPNIHQSFLCLALEAGHATFIERAVSLGTNPTALLLRLRDLAPTTDTLPLLEVTLRALDTALSTILMVTPSTGIYEIARDGYRAGPDGKALLVLLGHIIESRLPENIRDLGGVCLAKLTTIFHGGASLQDRCLTVIQDHDLTQELEESILEGHYQVNSAEHVLACAGPNRPSLIQLLAWFEIDRIDPDRVGLFVRLRLAEILNSYSLSLR